MASSTKDMSQSVPPGVLAPRRVIFFVGRRKIFDTGQDLSRNGPEPSASQETSVCPEGSDGGVIRVAGSCISSAAPSHKAVCMSVQLCATTISSLPPQIAAASSSATRNTAESISLMEYM
eukprot:scaffold149324_cov48-Prasinocladus_malaysianus.AAC.1